MRRLAAVLALAGAATGAGACEFHGAMGGFGPWAHMGVDHGAYNDMPAIRRAEALADLRRAPSAAAREAAPEPAEAPPSPVAARSPSPPPARAASGN
ncbi:hypothetical protein [Coralloluteibacterium thermophilus]|uniref:Lipoprotein n=1 Tax=Coralloluteibacterium thermophilum TaxID=2707049 RepID=A0ABV9NMB5_9GAMM